MNLRVVHLLSCPNDERELRSVEEVSQLARFGAEYIKLINPPWTVEVLPPPREANDRPFKLTPAHFGCWLAHRRAITGFLNPPFDALLICECDCVFTLPIKKVFARIFRAYQACVDHDLICFNFGPKHGGRTVSDLGDWMVTTSRLIETHCYMVPIGAKDRAVALFDLPWDAADYVWTVYGYDQGKHRIGIYDDKIVAIQGDGRSLVDNREKRTEGYFREIRQN